jgi:hypothetical protein
LNPLLPEPLDPSCLSTRSGYSLAWTGQLAKPAASVMIWPMREVCFVCGRKASRRCIAGSVLEHGGPESEQRRICSECCGKGRGRTIDCPDTCPHYRAGARAALLKLAELGGDPDVEIRYGEVLHNLRLGLARVRRGRLKDLSDGEARQAFANVADTMRARSSGLIFDFTSTDLRVQLLGDELLSVATLHERGEKGMARTDAVDLMKCLKYLERQTAAAEKLGRGETFYLDLVVQSVAGEFLTRDGDGLVGVPAEP